MTNSNEFKVGEIVRGWKAGTFVVLALTTEDGAPAARVQAVNPDDHSQRARGSLVLPFTALVKLEVPAPAPVRLRILPRGISPRFLGGAR
jgi:hypothetical protein